MLGICNGFQALIKLGLVPFGRIVETDANCPTLTYNAIGAPSEQAGAYPRGLGPQPRGSPAAGWGTYTRWRSRTARAASSARSRC